METELGRIDFQKNTIQTMSNQNLVQAAKTLHFFRYKTPEQKQSYDVLVQEITKRQSKGLI
jgi:hypothetical protein